MDSTTVEVKRPTWKRLNRLKEPGQSFDDVISGLIETHENGTKEQIE